jgi:putative membrane protein
VERHFFSADAKQRATSAVKEIEAATSAEVVVAVRAISGNYRSADYLCGALVAVTVLSLLLFLPYSFAIQTWPIELGFSFALGAWGCSKTGALRRGLTGKKRLHAEATRAARAAFYDLGVSRTTGRTGILVFVSLFERRVEVVADYGVPRAALTDAAAALDRAIAHPRVDDFVTALAALREPLAAALPRQGDDVNELPDDLDAEAEQGEST